MRQDKVVIGAQKRDSLDKVVPIHYVLWYIFDGVFEVEEIPVTKQWSGSSLLEPDLVH